MSSSALSAALFQSDYSISTKLKLMDLFFKTDAFNNIKFTDDNLVQMINFLPHVNEVLAVSVASFSEAIQLTKKMLSNDQLGLDSFTVLARHHSDDECFFQKGFLQSLKEMQQSEPGSFANKALSYARLIKQPIRRLEFLINLGLLVNDGWFGMPKIKLKKHGLEEIELKALGIDLSQIDVFELIKRTNSPALFRMRNLFTNYVKDISQQRQIVEMEWFKWSIRNVIYCRYDAEMIKSSIRKGINYDCDAKTIKELRSTSYFEAFGDNEDEKLVFLSDIGAPVDTKLIDFSKIKNLSTLSLTAEMHHKVMQDPEILAQLPVEQLLAQLASFFDYAKDYGHEYNRSHLIYKEAKFYIEPILRVIEAKANKTPALYDFAFRYLARKSRKFVFPERLDSYPVWTSVLMIFRNPRATYRLRPTLSDELARVKAELNDSNKPEVKKLMGEVYSYFSNHQTSDSSGKLFPYGVINAIVFVEQKRYELNELYKKHYAGQFRMFSAKDYEYAHHWRSKMRALLTLSHHIFAEYLDYKDVCALTVKLKDLGLQPEALNENSPAGSAATLPIPPGSFASSDGVQIHDPIEAKAQEIELIEKQKTDSQEPVAERASDVVAVAPTSSHPAPSAPPVEELSDLPPPTYAQAVMFPSVDELPLVLPVAPQGEIPTAVAVPIGDGSGGRRRMQIQGAGNNLSNNQSGFGYGASEESTTSPIDRNNRCDLRF